MTFDVEEVRAEFPILQRQVNGRPLVYLDSGASSQRPLVVIEAVSHYEHTSHANIHRGVYVLSEEATAAYEQAHQPKKLVLIPGGHFDPYQSGFEVGCRAARDWFRQHLARKEGLS